MCDVWTWHKSVPIDGGELKWNSKFSGEFALNRSELQYTHNMKIMQVKLVATNVFELDGTDAGRNLFTYMQIFITIWIFFQS